MVKVLVTGGAGFIGSHQVEYLLAQGDSVRILDDLSTGLESNIEGLEAELIVGSILDPQVCARAAKGMDHVIHLAALGSVPRSMADPAATNKANVDGTLNILIAARDNGVKSFVFASSSSVYGGGRTPQREDQALKPVSPYAVSKMAGEHYLRVFWESFGLPGASLRYFNVYGPRQRPDHPYAAVCPKFIEALKQNRPPVIFGDGLQSRSFVFVGDVVRANRLAALRAEALGGRALNIAGTQSITVLELWKRLAEAAGKPDLNPVHRPPRPGDVRTTDADVTRAENLLGWRPRRSPPQGLEAELTRLR